MNQPIRKLVVKKKVTYSDILSVLVQFRDIHKQPSQKTLSNLVESVAAWPHRHVASIAYLEQLFAHAGRIGDIAQVDIVFVAPALLVILADRKELPVGV